MPATGFYEWSGPRGKRQPHWIHPVDGGLFLVAGLFEKWAGEDGQGETTFTILTTDANTLIGPIHDRMPVILSEDAADEWLFVPPEQTERLRELLIPAPENVIAIQDANPAVGNVKNDGPELLAAVGGSGGLLQPARWGQWMRARLGLLFTSYYPLMRLWPWK